MTTMKRVIAFLLILCIPLTLAACHQKNEIAMEIDGVPIRSALYLAFLVNADREAMSTIDEMVPESDSDSSDSSESYSTSYTESEYRQQNIDGKTYLKWVRDKALEMATDYVYTEKLFDEYGLSFDADEEYTNSQTVDLYWSYYGMQSMYEQNGVSKDTFTEVMVNSSKRNKIFLHLYGEGGTEGVTKEQITDKIVENYAVANTIQVMFSSTDEESGETTTLTDEEKESEKSLLEALAKRLQEGESFESVKAFYDNIIEEATEDTTAEGTRNDNTPAVTNLSAASLNKSSLEIKPLADESDDASSEDASSEDASSEDASSEETSSDDTSSGEEAEEENTEPMDANATVYASEATGSSTEYFEDINEMEIGEIKVLEFSDSYMLVLKKDITEDPYYYKTYSNTAIHLMKDTEFEDMMTSGAKDLSVVNKDWALNNLTPDKLTYTASAS